MNPTQLERLLALLREEFENELPDNYSGELVIKCNMLNGSATKATITKDVRIK